MRKKIIYIIPSLVLFSAASTTVSCAVNDEPIVYSDVEFYVLSVGNANLTYLLEDGVATVFDAGYGLYDSDEDSLNRDNGWSWETNDAKTDWAVNFMTNSGVERIESIFISHKHTDHYNVVKRLTEEFETSTVYAPWNYYGLEAELPEVDNVVTERWQKEYVSNGRKYTNITGYASKDAIKAAEKDNDPNDTSMVLRFNVNGKNFMIPGDMTDQIFPLDKQFLKKATEKPIDVMLAAHHGSGNSFTKVYSALANKGYSLDHIFFSGTSEKNLSTVPFVDWSEFSGKHDFPADSVTSGLLSDYSRNGHPLGPKSIHVTGSGGSFGPGVMGMEQFDSEHFNHSFKYVSNAANNYEGEVIAINDNVTNYNKLSANTQNKVDKSNTVKYSKLNYNLFVDSLSQIVLNESK